MLVSENSRSKARVGVDLTDEGFLKERQAEVPRQEREVAVDGLG